MKTVELIESELNQVMDAFEEVNRVMSNPDVALSIPIGGEAEELFVKMIRKANTARKILSDKRK